jgi:eukaryotic translation initiation factor 2C
MLIAPSIAVSVSAVSGDNSRFCPAIRLQEGRKETITDLKDMMVTHICRFESNSGKKPAKIIMFRDGVSEGQYAKCAR